MLKKLTAAILITAMLTTLGFSAIQTVGEEDRMMKIAILDDESLRTDGNAPYDAGGIKSLFEGKGHSATVIDASAFACYDEFNSTLYDLIYIPTGSAFPAGASANLKRFFADGGKIITSGGYSFSETVYEEAELVESYGKALWVESKAVTASPCAYTRINASEFETGVKYTLSTQIKSQNITTSSGVAHASVYIYDDAGALLQWKDFVTLKSGSTDWTKYDYTFTVPDKARFVDLRFGLYITAGTMMYDDVKITSESGKVIYTEEFEQGIDHWLKTTTGADIVYSNDQGTKSGGDYYMSIYSDEYGAKSGFSIDVTDVVAKGSDVTVSFDEKIADVSKVDGGRAGVYLDLYKSGAIVETIDVSTKLMNFGWHGRKITFKVGMTDFDSAKLCFCLEDAKGKLSYDNISIVCNDKKLDDPNGQGSVTYGAGVSKERREKESAKLSSSEPIEVGDILRYSSDQIPIFDAETVYTDAFSVKGAENQTVFTAGKTYIDHKVSGFSAITVCGNNRGRWQPLLCAYDELGQIVGTVAAVFTLFSSPSDYCTNTSIKTWNDYLGTAIGFFGVTSEDLFATGNDELRDGLVALAEKLVYDSTICNIANAYDCYRDGESPRISIAVENNTDQKTSVEIKYSITAEDNGEVVFQGSDTGTVTMRSRKTFRADWTNAEFNDDFYYVKATLYQNGVATDMFETAFVVWDQEVVNNGPKYTYHDNYIYLQNDDGTEKAIYATGVDEGGPFIMENQNPLVWKQDFAKRADAGIYIYEVLQQYRGYHDYTAMFASDASFEQHMRRVDSAVYLSQRYGQIYMMGMLIGQNIAVNDEQLDIDKEYCYAMASRYKDVPGVIYYLNGDLILKMTDATDKQFREYLTERYGTDIAFKDAWGVSYGIADAKYDSSYTFNGKGWSDTKAYDQNNFRTTLIQRWSNALVESVHEAAGEDKIVLCEFYAWPMDGIDVPSAIGDLTYSNTGFFDKATLFAQMIAYADQRWQGKSFGIGETNKRTHPAFSDTVEDYYSSSSYEYARSFFFTTYNTTLALGGNHYQVWCWKDETKYTFPWGITTVYEQVAKDSYYWLRNSNVTTRALEPTYTVPEVAIITPDSTRMAGSKGWYEGHYQTLDAIDILQGTLANNVLTLNECNFDIPAGIKVIYYPFAYTVPDDVYDKLVQFVKDGGILYISGDPSYDIVSRKRTTDIRLTELCGVKTAKVRYAGNDRSGSNIEYSDGTIIRSGNPNVTVELKGAKALYTDDDGNPIITEYALGNGKVVYSTDPLEGSTDSKTYANDVALYKYVLSLAGVQTAKIKASTQSIKTFVTPLADGGNIRAIVNTSAADVRVEYTTGDDTYKFKMGANETGYIREDKDGNVIAMMFNGSITKNDGKYISNNAYAQISSLDGLDVTCSKQLIILPQTDKDFSIQTTAEWASIRVVYGQLCDGEIVLGNSGGDIEYTLNRGNIEIKGSALLKNRIIIITEADNVEATCNALVDLMTDITVIGEDTDVSDSESTDTPTGGTFPTLYIIIAAVLLVIVIAVIIFVVIKKKGQKQ